MNIKNLIERKKSYELELRDFEEFVKYLQSKKYSEKYVLEFLNTLEQKKCTDNELYNFALAMAKSGKMLNLSEKFDCCVDKYSFGKYSDGMSLILMSVLASVGLKFARVMSDNGQYGTKLSRLRKIDGFVVPKSFDDAVRNASNCGAFFLNYMGNIAPVTTVLYNICAKHNKFFELSYIAMIMANKIAVGANVLIGDIKVGEGAATTDIDELAKRLVSIGKLAKIKTVAVVTDLNCPVSASVGAKCEMQEVIDILSESKDHNTSRLLELAKEMVVCVLMATKQASSRTKAMAIFDESISSGKAYKRFCQIVENYGGNLSFIQKANSLVDVAVSYIEAPEAGYVEDIKLNEIYDCAQKIISDGKKHDDGAGVVLMCDEGDKVVEGQKLAKIYYSFTNKRYFENVRQLQNCFVISKEKKKTNKLLYKVVI